MTTITFMPIFAAAVLSLSLVTFAYERALVPLYGSVPTNYLLSSVLLAAMLSPAVHPVHIPNRHGLLYAAVALAITPRATYWIGVSTARRKVPVLGPALTHAFVLGPLAFVLGTLLLQEGSRVNYPSRRLVSWCRQCATTLISWWAVIQLSRRLWPHVVYLRRVSDSQISLNFAFLAFCAWILAHLKSDPSGKQKVATSRRLRFLVLMGFTCWWFAWPLLMSPILPHPLPAPYTHPNYPLRVLSAVESITGLIVVAEALPRDARSGESNIHSLRYLRASHSILGGVWMYDSVRVLDNKQPLMDSYGTYLGDSIYTAFVLQEAVRLVNSTSSRDMKEGLIIGLGTGISATAFNRHGITTTIIEIDPAVYSAARQYFGLPDPGAGRVFLEDARTWVSQQILTGSVSRFDFVVHDCFSGGGIPKHIYTLEFWNDLQKLVKADGIVAVNYAGYAESASLRLVLHTLMTAFEQCRAFHDHPDDFALVTSGSTFVNMVIFCTKSSRPLIFRKAQQSDYLGSPLRKQTLSSLEKREVHIGDILGVGDDDVVSDNHNPLGKLQDDQAFDHWLLMREVLPDVHWETY